MSRSEHPVDAAIARLAAGQHALFARRQAVRLRATRAMIAARLRSGRWDKIFPGLYRIGGAPDSWHQSLLAPILLIDSPAAASHHAAGRLHGLDGFGPGPLHIVTMHGHRPRRTLHGVVVRESRLLDPTQIQVIDCIPVTSIELTLLHLAGLLDMPRLEWAVEDAVRRRLTTPSRLADFVSSVATPGAVKLRKILAARDPRRRPTRAKSELALLSILRERGIPLPAVGFRVESGREVDFAYERARIVIEVQSVAWHSSPSRVRRDSRKHSELANLGWTVLPIAASDLDEDPDGVADTICTALVNAGHVF